ncbi:unnamed protein product [Peniophora sp. CBMAI 1063]|nr:unnamed protein product [Peniophora sp. CBMAI 1063]
MAHVLEGEDPTVNIPTTETLNKTPTQDHQDNSHTEIEALEQDDYIEDVVSDYDYGGSQYKSDEQDEYEYENEWVDEEEDDEHTKDEDHIVYFGAMNLAPPEYTEIPDSESSTSDDSADDPGPAIEGLSAPYRVQAVQANCDTKDWDSDFSKQEQNAYHLDLQQANNMDKRTKFVLSMNVQRRLEQSEVLQSLHEEMLNELNTLQSELTMTYRAQATLCREWHCQLCMNEVRTKHIQEVFEETENLREQLYVEQAEKYRLNRTHRATWRVFECRGSTIGYLQGRLGHMIDEHAIDMAEKQRFIEWLHTDLWDTAHMLTR